MTQPIETPAVTEPVVTEVPPAESDGLAEMQAEFARLKAIETEFLKFKEKETLVDKMKAENEKQSAELKKWIAGFSSAPAPTTNASVPGSTPATGAPAFSFPEPAHIPEYSEMDLKI